MGRGWRSRQRFFGNPRTQPHFYYSNSLFREFMGRHRQPREIAALKGALRVHPERYRNVPPKAALGLGDAPEGMCNDAKAVWRELAMHAAAGVLTSADRMLMELTANLIAQFRAGPHAFQSARLGHLIGCLARLGMTPVDRQRLSVPRSESTNPFAEF
jgi:hypothetical protein